MRTNRNIKLPSDLWSRMAETARAEGRSIDELVEEAALGLLKLREIEARDLELINKAADELNEEVKDVLRYQQT